MKIRQALRRLRESLKAAGITEYQAEAAHALSAMLGIGISEMYLRGEEESLSFDIDDIVLRRKAGEPLAYILGERWFMGMKFYVDKRVLIPRQETELLVELALLHIKEGGRALDVCTGSGCIAISLAKLSGASVAACDISEDALNVARKNAEDLSADVCFLRSDLLEDVRGKFDVITANPPYISDEEYAGLDSGVREFEPELALRADDNGLALYKRLAEQLGGALADGGFFCTEIGAAQGEAVRGIFSGVLTDLQIHKDYAGLDRIVSGIKKC